MFPGEHPHSDRPNWRLAETFEEYLSNCREGLEKYTFNRANELLGFTRMQGWRLRAMSEIPEPLMNHIFVEARNQGIQLSTKMLAQIGLAYRRGSNGIAEIERCPHCGGELRVRHLISKKMRAIINEWLAKQKAAPDPAPVEKETVICLPYTPLANSAAAR